jgi:hypothetical protein
MLVAGTEGRISLSLYTDWNGSSGRRRPRCAIVSVIASAAPEYTAHQHSSGSDSSRSSQLQACDGGINNPVDNVPARQRGKRASGLFSKAVSQYQQSIIAPGG